MRWFRFYDDALDDPKVQQLSGDLYKTWANLLCLASKHAGKLPPIGDISFRLRLSEEETISRIDALVAAGLLDKKPSLHPHNWGERQYKSDDHAGRMRRYRKRLSDQSPVQDRDVTGDATCDATVQSRDVTRDHPDTDTDTDKKQKVYRFSGRVVRLNEADFLSWKQAYKSIPDLEAELFRIDQTLAAQGKTKDWFVATSNMLAAKHQKLLAESLPKPWAPAGSRAWT